MDVIADWEINAICNLRCEYCFIQRRRGTASKAPTPDEASEGLESTGLRWLVHITGGEPFLQPRFVELCRRLTAHNYISVNTNLTTGNVAQFAAQVNPARVAFVHCSLHLDERRAPDAPGGGVEGFIRRYAMLRSAGFRVFATQVMYPGDLQRFREPFRMLKSEGIEPIPKVFRGHLGWRRYPGAYSRGERKAIAGYSSGLREEEWHRAIHLNPFLDRQLTAGDLSFKGLPCAAGRRIVIISPDGEACRCHGDRRTLGRPFEGSIDLLERDQPCPSRICPCPYHGARFASGRPLVLRTDPAGITLRLMARGLARRPR